MPVVYLRRDLEPLLEAVATELGLAARIKAYVPDKGADEPGWGQTAQILVVLARDEARLASRELGAGWVALKSTGGVRVWTDDYGSLIPLLKW